MFNKKLISLLSVGLLTLTGSALAAPMMHKTSKNLEFYFKTPSNKVLNNFSVHYHYISLEPGNNVAAIDRSHLPTAVYLTQDYPEKTYGDQNATLVYLSDPYFGSGVGDDSSFTVSVTVCVVNSKSSQTATPSGCLVPAFPMKFPVTFVGGQLPTENQTIFSVTKDETYGSKTLETKCDASFVPPFDSAGDAVLVISCGTNAKDRG